MQLIHTVTRPAMLMMRIERLNVMEAIQSATDIGINIIGIFVDPPGHVAYFVLEAESMEQIVQFFEPLLELGNTDISPVMSMQAALDALKSTD